MDLTARFRYLLPEFRVFMTPPIRKGGVFFVMNDSAETKIKIKIVPVIDTMPADLLTPLSVYLKLSKATESSFLLESVEGGESLARYSFIGVDPGMTVSGNAASTTIRNASGDVTRPIPMF